MPYNPLIIWLYAASFPPSFSWLKFHKQRLPFSSLQCSFDLAKHSPVLNPTFCVLHACTHTDDHGWRNTQSHTDWPHFKSTCHGPQVNPECCLASKLQFPSPFTHSPSYLFLSSKLYLSSSTLSQSMIQLPFQWGTREGNTWNAPICALLHPSLTSHRCSLAKLCQCCPFPSLLTGSRTPFEQLSCLLH